MGRGRYMAKGGVAMRMGDAGSRRRRGSRRRWWWPTRCRPARTRLSTKQMSLQSEAGWPAESSAELRTDFSETAFWEPHLLIGEDGSATFEFTVPDSVTEWNVWLHAVTRDLRGGSLTRTTRSVKDLMVRPYLPRFLREGDRAAIKVVVNNAGDDDFSGRLDFEILDPETEESLLDEFGLTAVRDHRGALYRRGGWRRQPDLSGRGPGAGGDGGLQSGGSGRGSERRRAAAAAAAARADAPEPVAVRDPETPTAGSFTLPTWQPATIRRWSTSSWWSPSMPSSSTACSTPCPIWSTTPTSAPSRCSTAFCRPASFRLALRRLSGGGADGEGVLGAGDPLRDLGRGRSQPQDGAGRDTLADLGQGWPGAGRGSGQGSRPAGRPGGAELGAGQAGEGPDLSRRLSLVAGRPTLALHDALHPPGLLPGAGVRGRGAAGRSWSRPGATCTGTIWTRWCAR